jgi:hypothetical protein
MRRRSAPFQAIAPFLLCATAFGQPKSPPDAETWREDEGELVDPDELVPPLPRSTERLVRSPWRLSLVAWHQYSTALALNQGVGLVVSLPFERTVARPAPGYGSGAPDGASRPPIVDAAPEALPTSAPARPSAPSTVRAPPPTPPTGLAPFALRPAALTAPSLDGRERGETTPYPLGLAAGPETGSFTPALGPEGRAVPTPFAGVAAASAAVRPGGLAADLPADDAVAALYISPAQTRSLAEAALRGAGLARSADGRLDGLASRARSSAVLPELRLRGVQSNDRALRLSYTEADPYRTQASGGSALLFEARATWRLDRLLYADDEIAVERLRGDLREQRQRLVLKVVEAVGAWQKAQLTLFDPEASPRERAAALGHASAASVLLDALCGGAWSRLRARGESAALER